MGTTTYPSDLAPRRKVRPAEKPYSRRTTASVDSQPVDTTCGGEQRGRDNAKGIDGRKRPIVVDGMGLPLAARRQLGDVLLVSVRRSTYTAERRPSRRRTGDLQQRVELLLEKWTQDRGCLSPTKVGMLADLDPAVIVTPPKGLEVGYLPIVARQGTRE